MQLETVLNGHRFLKRPALAAGMLAVAMSGVLCNNAFAKPTALPDGTKGEGITAEGSKEEDANKINEENDTKTKPQKESPWLVTPLLSSDPKLSTSLGAMAGYLYKFDKKSPTSMFAAMGTYSDTDSQVYGAFGRMYFNEDRQRLVVGYFGGEINNEYNDFLGTGWPLQSQDDLEGIFLRYSHRITESGWYLGATGLSSNYAITGADMFSQAILKFIGLTGFNSNALGLYLERDTRDNQNSPSTGSVISLQNLAYREALGGDVDFDTYDIKYRKYRAHHGRHVLALRLAGRWTGDAPPGGYSSIDLRGYTRGEYLAKHSSVFELEERMALRGRWGISAFAGVAALYGKVADLEESSNWFPAAGGGVNYLIKKDERMIVRAEVAAGKGGNLGYYLQFGNAF